MNNQILQPDIEKIWIRIESYLQNHAPSMLTGLQSGASDTQIRAAEEVMSIQFPEDVKLSYQIHNGFSADSYRLMDGWEFLSLERMQDEWQVWKELLDSDTFMGIGGDPQPGVRGDWWNALWIPLTYDGSGNHDCLDLDPGNGGNLGQIITMWHDEGERKIVAPSFRDWLEQYAIALESGKYLLDQE